MARVNVRATSSGNNHGTRGLFYAGVAALVIACAGEITDPEGYEPVGSAGSATNGGNGMAGGNDNGPGNGMAGGSMTGGRGGTGSQSSGGGLCNAGPVLLRKCSMSSSCHGDPSSQSTIVADRQAMIGVATERNSSCEKVLIDGADPSQSLILLKVQNTQPDNCGASMPPDYLEPLADFEISCIAEWVTQLQQ